ncbi:DUF3455 domain-containing protein [Puia dinghuensis]|uniref:DUF3455 domain-containing protein n=1 Tax=Puia dinghuensis TaxID=1792502 RepID=A0A8J2U7U2_9BACT|nr:DUF3455 domain-containing protein [Puia dinghuensis]GGA84562.1 hypothetical protein GCM10011511_04500 [Puia dinghuensis]
MRVFHILVGVMLVLVSARGFGQNQSIPSSLEVPKGNKLILHTYAKGVQIYVCAPMPTDTSRYVWTLAEPQATLYSGADYQQQIGKHYFDDAKHPTWESTDGSKVVGAKFQQADAPDPDAIPWLLLQATSTSQDGQLGKITFIQRINTKGGKAPSTGASRSHKGQYRRVEYTAEYLFYGRD